MNRFIKEFKVRYLYTFLFALSLLLSNISADTLKIAKIGNINISVNQYSKYTLPSKVTAIMTNNSKQQVAIKWMPGKLDTRKAGKYSFKGTVMGWTKPVILTIEVKTPTDNGKIVQKPIIKELIPCETTIKLGEKVIFPNTVIACYSDGKKMPVKVLWDSELIDTNEAGLHQILGKVEGYWGVASFNIYVKDIPVVFSDRNFENCIRELLKKPTGDIYTEELAWFQDLTLENKGISNIDGIEYFRNIKWLGLYSNKITDVSKIANLKKLTTLYLSDNPIKSTLLLKEMYSKLENKDFLIYEMSVNEETGNSKLHLNITYPLKDTKKVRILISPESERYTKQWYLDKDVIDGNLVTDIMLPYGKGTKLIQISSITNDDTLDDNLMFTVINNDNADLAFLLPTLTIESDNETIISLAKDITKDCKNDMERTRAIHDWITSNIAYDTEEYFSNNVHLYTASEILHRKKAVCGGYTDLNAALHRAIGIKAKTVVGITLYISWGQTWENTKHYQLHAWNEIWVDNRWVVEDTTWDAGFVDFETQKFTFKPHYKYFDPSPEQFAIDHKKLAEDIY